MNVSYVPRKPGPKPVARPNFEEVMKIGTPEFIAAAPAPEVPEWRPTAMQDRIPEKLPEGHKVVQRVTEADLSDLVGWTLPRFAARWPSLSEIGLTAYARMALSDRFHVAFRTENAWGIALLEQEFWDPRPVCRTKFIVSKIPTLSEATALLTAMKLWAFERKAYEFHIDENTEYNLEPLAKRIGAKNQRILHIVKPEEGK